MRLVPPTCHPQTDSFIVVSYLMQLLHQGGSSPQGDTPVLVSKMFPAAPGGRAPSDHRRHEPRIGRKISPRDAPEQTDARRTPPRRVSRQKIWFVFLAPNHARSLCRCGLRGIPRQNVRPGSIWRRTPATPAALALYRKTYSRRRMVSPCRLASSEETGFRGSPLTLLYCR